MTVLNDLWIIGDVFVNKNYYMLPQMKNEARHHRRQSLYIYDYFNVFFYAPNPLPHVNNALARVVNSYIKALNDAVKLPRIVLVPDSDILRFARRQAEDMANNANNANMFIEGALKWVMNQLSRATEAKKDEIQRRKPEAVLSYEPKMLWVKMMDCLNGSNKTIRLRSEYNEVSEEMIANKPGHFIIDVNQAMLDVLYFDASNKINDYGRVKFWTEIDQMIEKFERRLITLKPNRPGFRTNFAQRRGFRGRFREHGCNRADLFHSGNRHTIRKTINTGDRDRLAATEDRDSDV